METLTYINLFLNLINFVQSIISRQIILAACCFFHLYLLTAQAFQMSEDIRSGVFHNYLFHQFNSDGLESALLYFAVCQTVLFILLGIRSDNKPVHYSFLICDRISNSSYFGIFIVLLSLSSYLIFFLVGLNSLINDTRPGLARGTTMLLVFISIGIMPALENILGGRRLSKADYGFAGFTIIVTFLFSRIHAIAYLLSIFVSIFYAYNLYNKRFNLFFIAKISVAIILIMSGFFLFGEYRDKLNVTEKSSLDLGEMVFDFLDSRSGITASLRNSVEGMSGLSGAMTKAQSNNLLYWPGDFGLSSITTGIYLMVPGNLKAEYQHLFQPFIDMYWYRESIVSCGAEVSFVSFGLLGCLVYPIILYLVSRRFGFYICRAKTLWFKIAMAVGCGLQVFCVRGSWMVWVSYILAYSMAVGLYVCLRKINFISYGSR